jgi:hypothetical protein
MRRFVLFAELDDSLLQTYETDKMATRVLIKRCETCQGLLRMC